MNNSNWRILLRNFRLRYLPYGTRRYQIVRSAFYWVKDFNTLAFLRRALNRYMMRTGGLFENRYIPENFGQTILYTDCEDIFPNYPFRHTFSGPRERLGVTLISTLKNEAPNVQQWIERIYQQSRLPDEIVLVDGGSTDGTLGLLQSLASRSVVTIHVLQEPGANIAHGRNIAITQAENNIIAVIDFGCQPEVNWLENIIAPFEIDEQMEVVNGWYVAIDHHGKIIRRKYWPRLDQIQPDSFIPSSRSIAFKKDVWKKVGGYPEWLTLTGEDTYFALELRRFSSRRAFVPEAIVQWFAPVTAISYWKKIFYWSIGDGEAGLNSVSYFHTAKWLAAAAVYGLFILVLFVLLAITRSAAVIAVTGLFLFTGLAGIQVYKRKSGYSLGNFFVEIGAMVAQARGYFAGFGRREEVDQKRFASVKGVFVILAGVPIHDTGGGSRGAQIALEMLRQNYLVVYINKFESYESVSLGLRFQHPNLPTYQLSDFSWDEFIARYGNIIEAKPCGALVEFPLKEFIPLIEKLRSVKITIGYDLLDDWDTQLGSTWYDKETEKHIISLSDNLIATAPVLADRLTKFSPKPVSLLPNAVNLRLFNVLCEYEKPDDLPTGSFIITYIGALWGEWFDWDLLVDIAKTFPEAAVLVIGDYRGQCPVNLSNLHFLGLKAQASLPAYLKYSDVAIIPWKENEITYATSPLKLYEYLAMHVPVVVPNLPPLYNIPFVYVSDSNEAFLQNIKIAQAISVHNDPIDKYIHDNSWEYRVEQLANLLYCQG